MDYAQDGKYRMQQYGQKVPFYMTHPMQEHVVPEGEYELDAERMKYLYPKQARRLQPFINDVCDKMEYEGSAMFDEYPDKVQFEQLTSQVLHQMPDREYRREDRRDLVEALLWHEIYRRRCRYRRCRKWW